MYRDQRNYENLNRAKFIGAGAFDIPRILAEVPATPQSWIGFNYAKSCKDPANKAVHFFVDDYQFNRLWTNPDAYLDMLRRFKAVCTPDFSTIYFYGLVPEGISGPIVHVAAFQEQIKARTTKPKESVV